MHHRHHRHHRHHHQIINRSLVMIADLSPRQMKTGLLTYCPCCSTCQRICIVVMHSFIHSFIHSLLLTFLRLTVSSIYRYIQNLRTHIQIHTKSPEELHKIKPYSNNMIRLAIILLLSCISSSLSSSSSSSSSHIHRETLTTTSPSSISFNFFTIGDWGAGTANQSQVAETMGKWGERLSPQFVIALGDNIYSQGVQVGRQVGRQVGVCWLCMGVAACMFMMIYTLIGEGKMVRHTYIHTYLPTYLPTGREGSPLRQSIRQHVYRPCPLLPTNLLTYTYTPTYLLTYLHTYLPSYMHRGRQGSRLGQSF